MKCPSIMTRLKVGKTKHPIVYSLNVSEFRHILLDVLILPVTWYPRSSKVMLILVPAVPCNLMWFVSSGSSNTNFNVRRCLNSDSGSGSVKICQGISWLFHLFWVHCRFFWIISGIFGLLQVMLWLQVSTFHHGYKSKICVCNKCKLPE